MEKELGIKQPDEVNIGLIEEKENERCLILPRSIFDKNELTDRKLGTVNGADSLGWTLCLISYPSNLHLAML